MTDGRIGPGRFWAHGRLAIIRHTDGVFELLCEDIPVMGPRSFEAVTAYLWMEFDLFAG